MWIAPSVVSLLVFAIGRKLWARSPGLALGTTGGLFVLFLSMQIASGSLELSALAMALTSSIFALVAFAILEALKFQLYRRMLERIDDAMSFHRHLSENPMPNSPGTFSTGSPEPLLGRA